MSGAAVAPTRLGGPVLVLAPLGDRLAGTASDELARRGVPVLWLDPRDFPGGWDVGWSASAAEGFLAAPGVRVSLTELRSVLARPGSPSRFDAVAEEDREYVGAEVTATMLGLLAGLECPVVNRPRPGGVGRAVVRAGGRLAACGLALSPTLVTWEPDAATEFYRSACDQRALVGRPTGSTPPELIEGQHGADWLAHSAGEPLVLQSLPAGERANVIVIGERTILLDGDGLGAAERAACVRAAAALGLALAQFDLALGSAGAVCLEVSELPDLPTNGHEHAVVGALCDLLADGAA
jgi:hypothetical protein